MRRLALVLLLAASPAAAQHRAGFGVMNLGPLTYEDSAYVRSGNSGMDAFVYAEIDVGEPGAWYAGLTFGPSRIFVWAIRHDEPRISRWSWRPGYHDAGNTGQKDRHDEHTFFWLMPEVGYDFETGLAAFRPHLGGIWPVGIGYAWGAPVGAQPFAGITTVPRLPLGDLQIAGWFRVGWKRAHGWTVLQDWSTPEHGVADPRSHWLFMFGIQLGAEFR